MADSKVVTTHDGRKTHHSVELSVNEDLCLFQNYDDSWCIAATPPMVKAGWEWAQAYTTTTASETPVLKYYQLELLPYLQIQANIINTLFIQNLWVTELTFDLDQFKTNWFISMIFNEDFAVCPGFGWEANQVLLRILWTMKFWNCSKTLINDLADFSTTWTGYNAQYFEDCNQSNNAEVILFEKVFKEAEDDII